jgi:hypothetical protein
MKNCIIAILVNIFIYLCFAFIVWEFNPANWEEVCRVIYILFTGGFTFCFLGVQTFDK